MSAQASTVRSVAPPAAPLRSFTIDVEDWFHILDTDAAPEISRWHTLEARVDRNLETLLELLDETGVRATMFWLGWLAERHPELVRRCHDAGHEIASHGYGHVLAFRVGEAAFFQDIDRAKKLIEDVAGAPITGFRAPGFGITNETSWAFDAIKRAGYQYDSSVFPLPRGHGGMAGATLGPHWIETKHGALAELPMSAVEVLGRRLNLFGGGYLRLAPRPFIRWGIARLERSEQPLVVYIHPREIDPEQPRLPLPWLRRFKSYVNLETTLPKLRWLCETYRFQPLREQVDLCFFHGAGNPAT